MKTLLRNFSSLLLVFVMLLELLDIQAPAVAEQKVATNVGTSIAQEIETKKPEKSEEEAAPLIVENPPSDTTEDIEKDIWDCIYEITKSEVFTAAMMGNAHRESRMTAYRWENDIDMDENGVFTLSRKYTDKVNELLISKDYKSARNTFINMNPLNNWSGFGLFGFTARGHKENLIDFCIVNGYLIDDELAQCKYVLYYIMSYHPDLYSELCNETKLYDCVKKFAFKFEKCESSEQGMYDRCRWARYYFEKFGTSELVR